MVEIVASGWGGWEYDAVVELRRGSERWSELVKGL